MSIGPPKTTFSNDDLVELEWVFASVCEALEAAQGKQDDDEKACIRRRLFVLASNGMSEPKSLRDSLIRSFTRPKKVPERELRSRNRRTASRSSSGVGIVAIPQSKTVEGVANPPRPITGKLRRDLVSKEKEQGYYWRGGQGITVAQPKASPVANDYLSQ